MIIGIACTVIIGLVAAYQTMAARAYRDAAESYRIAHDVVSKRLDEQRGEMLVANARLDRIAAALPPHFAAARRGDARACNAILAAAVAPPDPPQKTS